MTRVIPTVRPLLVAATVVLLLVPQGCSARRPARDAALDPTGVAFVEAMIPYERAAIATSRAVRSLAAHRTIRLLITDTVSTQRLELGRLADAARHGPALSPTPAAYRKLPLSLVERNWVRVEVNSPRAALRSDRDVIEALFGRYMGALYMAKAALRTERDGWLRAVIVQILRTRERWLTQLDALHARYYGVPVPFE